MSRASEISTIGTGPPSPRCASSVKATTADRLLSLIEIIDDTNKGMVGAFQAVYPTHALRVAQNPLFVGEHEVLDALADDGRAVPEATALPHHIHLLQRVDP